MSDKTRAEFEFWASDEGRFPRAVERSGEGYSLAQTQASWGVWQAANEKYAPSTQQQEAEPVGVVTQDVDEFIAESAYCTPIRDEYGDTHYETDTVDVDDLRAWMAGHVRVPVDPTEEMIEAGCKQNDRQQNPRYSNNELSEYGCKAIYKAMLSAAKEPS